MPDETRAPKLHDGAYLIKKALAFALTRTLREIHPPDGDLTLLDIGGRGRPYAVLVAESQSGRAGRTHHFVVDPGPDSAGADLIGTAERLPIAGGAVGMVLCTQVLEHVEDPRAAVAEMARVLEPAGVCLLTTHGTWFYHPDPEDYWRWTPAGLVRLFRDSGFDQVTVRPVGGIIRALLIAPCNRILWSLLKGRVTGRQSEPGELVIDYIVTATRP